MNGLRAFVYIMLLWPSVCQSARILVLSPVGSKSHKFSLMPIAKGLIERGHVVTLVTSHEPTEHLEGLTEITAKNIFDRHNSVNWFEQLDQIGFAKTWKFMNFFSGYNQAAVHVYNDLMAQKEFRKIVVNRLVDLVILDESFNDFCLPIIDHLGVPFVYHSSASGNPWTWNSMGATADSAFIPIRYTPFSDEMTFIERLMNTIQGFSIQKMREWVLIPGIEEYTRKDFPNARPIEVIEKNASLFFTSTHCTTYWTRSLPLNVIPIGSLHAQAAKTLPEVIVPVKRREIYY